MRTVPRCLGSSSWGCRFAITPRFCGLYRISLILLPCLGSPLPACPTPDRKISLGRSDGHDRACETRREVTASQSQTCPVRAYVTASKSYCMQLGLLTSVGASRLCRFEFLPSRRQPLPDETTAWVSATRRCLGPKWFDGGSQSPRPGDWICCCVPPAVMFIKQCFHPDYSGLF